MLDLEMLNPEQREAVLHAEGPCCVVAGAGSGKTRVLTYRVANLIEHGIPARNILAVTFTKKAATEMGERLAGLVGNAFENLTVGTFHSICYRILRHEWQSTDGRIYEPAQDGWRHWTLKSILNKDLNWRLDVSTAMGFISWQKSNLITPNDRLDMRNADPFLEDKYRDLYKQYETTKERDGKLDFDDMLLWCYRLLRDNPSIRRRYQALFRYVMIDEYQDTNLAQNEIAKMLAEPHRNIFVVGDARQAIYSWRAAKMEFILNFERDWPGTRVIVLKTNYRSTSNIVETSNRLIGLGTVPYPGKCTAFHGTVLDPIECYSENEDAEADFVVNEIKGLCLDGSEYRDFACLYRVNAQSRALEDALIKNEIPYVILGAQGFYNRKEVRDIIAYLRILSDPDDEEAISRVMNIPTRYLGKAFLSAAKKHAQSRGTSLLDAMYQCPESMQRKNQGIHDFMRCIKQLRRLDCTPSDMIVHARKISGYDRWLLETEGSEDSADNQRIENLTALAAAASRFSRLQDFLFYAEQARSKPADPDTGGSRVQLMTLHKSKGLEFPAVFLCGLNQGILPHQRSCVYEDGELLPESIEEERRLLYVGMTRAKKLLYLSALAEYQNKPMERSIFLDEIAIQVQEKVAGKTA